MPEFDIEAAIQLVADIGLRPAARRCGLNHATLYCRIQSYRKRQANPQTAPQAAPESALQHAPNLDRRDAEIRVSKVGLRMAAMELGLTAGELYEFLEGIPPKAK
jgi:hypothetical protein